MKTIFRIAALCSLLAAGSLLFAQGPGGPGDWRGRGPGGPQIKAWRYSLNEFAQRLFN